GVGGAVVEAGERLGDADRADRRMAEDGRWDGVVVDGRRVAAEYRLGEGLALADRHRRQVQAVGAVADGVDALDPALRVLVDHHGPVGTAGDAGLVEPDARRVGLAPDGIHDAARLERGAVAQGEAQGAAAALLRALDRRSDADIDALLAHLGGKRVADVVVEAAQDLLAAVELHDLGPKPIEDSGELHRDVAATGDDDALRQLRQVECLVRGDAEFRAGLARPYRPRPDGDEDVAGG